MDDKPTIPPWVKPHLRRRLEEERQPGPKEMEKGVVKVKHGLPNSEDIEMAKRDLKGL